MPNLGMGELVIILLIVLVIFGASRLPQIGEGVGKAIRNLKKGLDTDDEIQVKKQQKQIASPETLSKKEKIKEGEIVDS